MVLQTSLRIGRTTMHAHPLRHVPDVEDVGFGEIEGIQELNRRDAPCSVCSVSVAKKNKKL